MLLENIDINGNIWLFLGGIKDIVHLMTTSKRTHEICIESNKVVTAIIKISEIHRSGYITEQERKEMIRNIIQSFPNISKLIINNKTIIFGEESLSQIYKSDSLQRSLKELKFMTGDEGLLGISNVKNLLSLDLGWTDDLYRNNKSHGITDVGLSHLSSLIKLTSLDLSYCDITDVGLSHLSGFINLTSLNLSNCGNITDVGLSPLSGLINLTSLNLSDCRNITYRCWVK